MKKKIGILTLPPRINYGGILQAYALSKVVENLGFHVDIIERLNNTPSFFWKILSHLKTIGLRLLGSNRPFTYWFNNSEFDRISEKTRLFTNEFFNKKTVYSSIELNDLLIKSGYYALIVGSDQVWRPDYVTNINDYFFDFNGLDKVRKLSYAASMGVEVWPYSKQRTKKILRLCSRFKAISVREDVTKKILESRFGLNVQHVLDPTMLLSKEHYIDLFQEKKESKSSGNLFTYILDPTKEKNDLVFAYEKKMNLKAFSCQPLNLIHNLDNRKIKKTVDSFVYPRVTQWLRSFYDAEFVITDSFHGCVFSIIFNKPFIVLSNESRGQARFTSLLSLFNLTERLSDLTIKELPDINWDEVNEIKRKEVESSLNYLEINLY